MNTARLQNAFWNFVRPLHAPATRFLRRRFGRNYAEHPEMELPPPYEALALEVERNLHRYLHIQPAEIDSILIVGANAGDEVLRMRRSYPHARFVCFEPSPRWFGHLSQTHRGLDYVECRELALGDRSGKATFHELPMAGNGSLLAPNSERWAQFTKSADGNVTSYEVQVSTLDQEASSLDKIDLLWVDVQGAEGLVLAGGTKTLPRVQAVFLEVWMAQSAYDGALLFSEVNVILEAAGFTCVGLGIDGWSFTGNALWVRDIVARTCRASLPS